MTKHQKHKRIWIEGEEAFEIGLSLEDNPYPEDSDEYVEWAAGWQFAQSHSAN